MKPYRIETALPAARPTGQRPGLFRIDAGRGREAILEELAALRLQLDEGPGAPPVMGPEPGPADVPASGPMPPADRAAEGFDDATRERLAALLAVWRGPEGARKVTAELHAVVDETSRAAVKVLATAEEMEAGIGELRESSPDACREISALFEQTVNLFEASHFHDLTGQRIGNVLRAIESFGDQLTVTLAPFEAIPVADPPVSGDADMLCNGPMLPGAEGHIHQSEIDKMFD